MSDAVPAHVSTPVTGKLLWNGQVIYGDFAQLRVKLGWHQKHWNTICDGAILPV